jgi:hypothetical protein
MGLRVVRVERRLLGTDDVVANLVERGLDAEAARRDAVAVLDRLRIPDGTPFVVDDQFGLAGVAHLNRYVIDAVRLRALDLKALRETHVYHLVRLLRFVRHRRALLSATAANTDIEQWLRTRGVPNIDLRATTREDWIAYKEWRLQRIELSSWRGERGSIGGFFTYATSNDLMADPRPRWGRSGRDTTAEHTSQRKLRFLTEPQLRSFLHVGIHGQGDTDNPPGFPERDYSFALTLVATGLRREEGALLLDAEVPRVEDLPPGGVGDIVRYGKGGRSRRVYFTCEHVRALDLDRMGEREQLIEFAQPALRRAWRAGTLLEVTDIRTGRGGTDLTIGGRRVPAVGVSDEERAVAARRRPDGTIEPLALFLSRRGVPPGLKRWNELFTDAHDRLARSEETNQPPAHLQVTPHVMRHILSA